MRKVLITLITFYVSFLIPSNTLAINNGIRGNKLDLIYSISSNKKSNINSSNNDVDVQTITRNATDKVEEEVKNLEAEKYNHDIWKLQYERKIFEYQHISSIVLLCVSLMVLICGLYFSYMQFKDRTGHIDTNKAIQNSLKDLDNDEESKTSLKIGMAGIEISSSIIGLLILCVSLAFFYLYIANIYPVVDSAGNNRKIPSSKLDDNLIINNDKSIKSLAFE